MNNDTGSTEWWTEAAGFFGSFYLQGDNSFNGHLVATPLSQEARTQREVDGVCRLTDIQLHDQVLDIPCGAGRHTIALAARGINVVGFDLNETHLHVAREQAETNHVRAVFKHGDMRALNYEHEFDVVINMFYSFGFFADENENRQVLQYLRRALKPGGRFLMHTDVNLQRIRSGRYRLHEKRHLRNGGILHIDEHFDESNLRIHGSWTIEHDGKVTHRRYSMRVYEVEEFIELCLSCGFTRCDAYGDWNGCPYTATSEEIVFVAYTN